MKKLFLTVVLFGLGFSAFAQLSGDIVRDNRKLLTEHDFVIKGHLEGKITFAIAVNAEGEITSANPLDSESTIRSTPLKIKAFQHVKTFRFEPGTWFPKFHQGKMTITIVKT